MYHRIPDFPLSFLEIRPPLVVSLWPSMVVLPSWFFPGPPSWWYSLMVFPWPSVVVFPSWFLPGPPWWHSPRGFSLALRGFSLALRGGTPLVVSLWPSMVVLLSWFLPGPP
jgi:hypothetical protein